MHIVIIGAGLSGVCAAWYLRDAGHRVTVVDRNAGPALETSFANGGQISISHPEPWANPGAPLTVLRWLGRDDAPLLFRWPAEPARIAWCLRFLRECLPRRTRRNTLAIARLAVRSGELLRQLRAETGIQYDQLTGGVLHLYFAHDALRHGEAQYRILDKLGIPARMLSPEQCAELEPALAGARERLVGGMHGMADESGDAQRFCSELAQRCRQAGVQFVFDCQVERIATDGHRVVSIDVIDGARRSGALAGDAYVLAAGSQSAPLMRPLGLHLPIYPVKGYSATLAIRESARAPVVSLTDESRRIVCSRLGDKLRIAGTAELNAYNLDIDPARCAALLRWAEEMFPGACDLAEPHCWAGLRPTTPGNLPIIGRSRYPNLFFNTGHGTLGWTLACASAKALADIVDRQDPEVEFPFMGRYDR